MRGLVKSGRWLAFTKKEKVHLLHWLVNKVRVHSGGAQLCSNLESVRTVSRRLRLLESCVWSLRLG